MSFSLRGIRREHKPDGPRGKRWAGWWVCPGPLSFPVWSSLAKSAGSRGPLGGACRMTPGGRAGLETDKWNISREGSISSPSERVTTIHPVNQHSREVAEVTIVEG